MRSELPTGTVTFLFTDVEGSTRLLHELGADRYANALAQHRSVVREACAAEGGIEVDTQGDAFFFAFPTAQGALAAAEALTSSLSEGPIRVRVGLHTGSPVVTGDGYVGADVHRAARIAAAAHGGQVIVSAATAALVDGDLRDLGEHRFKGLPQAERVYQLGDADFPPLASMFQTNLPAPPNVLVGRKKELADVLQLLSKDNGRLVTVTGPGGIGKTRFALAAASEAAQRYPDGVWLVDLTALTEPVQVAPAIEQAVSAKVELERHFGSAKSLLLLDNFEQVVAAAADVASLLAACPRLTILVTSREPLRVAAEREYPLKPLPESPAVELFRQRVTAATPDCEVEYTVAAEICRLLDGLPLAIELAAARVRAFDPDELRARLEQRLPLLASRGRDVPERQRTLRATIEWSYDLLSDEERGLFRRLSQFSGGCTLDAAEAVADADVDLLQSLVEKSLVRHSGGRYSLLETIRQYAAERLNADEADDVRRRHRAHYVRLARASAPSLHTGRESQEAARLATEHDNFRATIAYALAADELDDVAAILGALYPFLISRGNLAESREWTEAVLAARASLSGPGLADALTAGSELARFAGDLERAIQLKEELASIQDEPQRPNWRAATLADLSEIALAQGNLDRAHSYAERSAAAGGGARVELAFAEIALRRGDLQAAQAHAETARDGLEPGSFNHACALELFGEVARRGGASRQARDSLAEALAAFAALRDPGGVADALEGLARLAADDDRLDRAGRLVGAAAALRQSFRRQPSRTDAPWPDVPAPAVAAGADLSLDDAVEYALSDD